MQSKNLFSKCKTCNITQILCVTALAVINSVHPKKNIFFPEKTMSIDSAASLLQTVSTISSQLKRGLTISVNNSHMHYHLKNMEYWSETDCFNAPTLSIDPGKWGVG